MYWKNILKRIQDRQSKINEMDEWVQVFINSLYEMHGDLDRGHGNNWLGITRLIAAVLYSGAGAEHKDIMKKFKEIMNIIENKYIDGKELKNKLETIIDRRKGERYA